jgi:hypothetical protein
MIILLETNECLCKTIIMAILKTESNKGFIGRVGNTVTYVLNGQIVKRTIGKRTEKPSIPQLSGRQKTTLIAKFLNPVKEYITVGFEFEAMQIRTKNAHNIATSYNWLNAITGVYPDQKIDYSKVLLSRGKMAVTDDIDVKVVDNKLEFLWDTACTTASMKESDRVMLLAYSPQENSALCLIGGAERLEGSEYLVIPDNKGSMRFETYVSFISADYKSISNSVYTGQFFTTL